jgi:hypothetical protein
MARSERRAASAPDAGLDAGADAAQDARARPPPLRLRRRQLLQRPRPSWTYPPMYDFSSWLIYEFFAGYF